MLSRAALHRVSGQFLAALGMDRVFDRYVEAQVEDFCHQALRAYKREIQHERGRLLMASPLDYKAVRALDREMEEVSARLHALEAARRH